MRVVPSSLLAAPPETRTVSPHLVAGKAPWQTARCACRLARCACRSSSQKVLRYFLGALFARARSLRGKPCIEPCSEQLLRSIQDPSTDARDDVKRMRLPYGRRAAYGPTYKYRPRGCGGGVFYYINLLKGLGRKRESPFIRARPSAKILSETIPKAAPWQSRRGCG